MSSFFTELKRRNVFRVGVAYIVVSWLIIQVIETVSDPLHLPEWTETFFIVTLLAGLPVALIFSWAFELTPEGLKKTRDVDVEQSVAATTGRKLNYTIIAVLVVSLGYFLWERQGLVEQAQQAATKDTEVTQTEGPASVAVLPFVNMSADPDQEFFSDGISEELLNLLAQIPELRVPARTSSFQFKGQNLDISDVAKQLNVKHVLEGSVRKADVRVRITAQLIEADTGYHLWSETYDRELDDIFAIQDEISAAIVAELSDALGLETTSAPTVVHAASTEAYNVYLLAQHQVEQRTLQSLESAISNYEIALEHDPDYAPAHAGLGLAWYLLTASPATYGALALDESLAKALPHLERALELDPELPEALGNYGLVLSAQNKDDEAIPYFEKALALNPSLTDVRNWYSQSLGELGRPDDALDQMEKAYQADPLSVLTLANYTNQLMARRRFDTLEPVLDRLTQIDPVRGSTFRAWMEVSRGRAADGIAMLVRAIDRDSGNLRLRRMGAYFLWQMGFEEVALSVWPHPDNQYGVLKNSADLQFVLEITREYYDRNPDDPNRLPDLAWAHFNAGEEAKGLELAGQYLDTLSDTRRPQALENVLFAFDAWQRGDEEAMLARIDPIENMLDMAIASGVEDFEVRLGKAVFSQMRGKPALALEHIEKAAFRSVVSPGQMGLYYDIAGWEGRSEFDDLRRRHRDYMSEQHAELLAVACGPDGFDIWQPSADECGGTVTPMVPN